MILETDDEKNAFKYVLSLASELTSRRGCNDLEEHEQKMFRHIRCPPDGDNDPRNLTYDFDIIYWLEQQVKK